MRKSKRPKVTTPRYRTLADQVGRQILEGVLAPGERAPSLRELAHREGASLTTAVAAYMVLEARGLLEARARSGFFVRSDYRQLPEPDPPAARASRPRKLGPHARSPALSPNLALEVSFDTAAPAPELQPTAALNRLLRNVTRTHPLHGAEYGPLGGSFELRRQIARRAAGSIRADDLVITCGATEAIYLALRVAVPRGAAIVVESPTYFGILRASEAAGGRVIEVPSHPRHGIDLGELDRVAGRYRVAACVVMPTCHNPLGCVVDAEARRELLSLAARHDMTLVEDDVFGDLAFDEGRPPSLYRLAAGKNVLLCASFSKSLAPGLRLGWVASDGSLAEAIRREKAMISLTTPLAPQLALAAFLGSGAYDHHLRRLRAFLRDQTSSVAALIARYFPQGTKVSRPAGGFLLWVQLPAGVDGDQLVARAAASRIGLLGGSGFSASGRFRDHVRISCGQPVTPRVAAAIQKLGALCGDLLPDR